jgi:hypothetical protein
MCFTGQVVLFVEGSQEQAIRGREPLAQIWQDLLGATLGLLPFARIRPISKKNLLAMDRGTTRSGVGVIPLDELILRELNGEGVDIAVIAWDLVPAWNPEAACCRHEEVVELYRLLAHSSCLPQRWRNQAQARFQQLRQANPLRPAPTRSPLRRGEVFAVCLENVFESVFDAHEDAIRVALGVAGRNTPGWPHWQQGLQRPDNQLLQPAILAARALRPRPAVCRQIRGDMRTNKNAWGARFLRTILNLPASQATFREHRSVKRLETLLHRDRGRCR